MTAARPPSRAPLRPLDDALAELLAHAKATGGTETVSTFDADGRVLAHDLVATLQVPPQDNSSMDGYAVRSAEVARAVAEGRALPVSQRIPAGSAAAPLAAGSVARIFTGAPVPEGADAIVMQEDTEAARDGSVRILKPAQPGDWIRRSGEDVTRGTTVLHAGERLGPASLGLAAGIGMATVEVARRPRVALFSTGDELVMPGELPPERMPPGAIYNSNRFFLRSLLLRLGCDVTDLGIVPDRREATLDALRSAATAHDLILTSGGVSVGEEDHIKPAVQRLGRLDLWQIGMKPGKPFAYGVITRDTGGACHFIGLPGNPVSSFVTFLLLVRPFVLKLQGATRLSPVPSLLPANFEWPRADRRREFLRVRRDADGGLALFPNQSSGVLTSVAWCDGLVDVAAGRTIQRGDPVPYLDLGQLLS